LIRPFRLLACKIARNFRKMRHRGYGPKIENYDIAPRDPEIEEKRKQAMQAMLALIEERASQRLLNVAPAKPALKGLS